MSRARADEDDERPGTIPWDDDHVARAIEARRALDTSPKGVARRHRERMNEKCETTDETTTIARTRRRDRSRTSESLP